MHLREMLRPTRSTNASCTVLLANANLFSFKPGVIQLLPTFHRIECKTCTYTLRNLKMFVQLSMMKKLLWMLLKSQNTNKGG